MCFADHAIKLCSCSRGEKLPANYWILHRFVGQKEVEVMGDIVMPLFGETHQYNENILLQFLNVGNCFDKPIMLINRDQLELHFQKEEKHDYFLFEFRNKSWEFSKSTDYFELENKYDKIKSGKISTDLDIFLE